MTELSRSLQHLADYHERQGATNKPAIEVNTENLKAFFACDNTHCADECTYPADMLFWCQEEKAWLCEQCADYADLTKGISLAEWFKKVNPSIVSYL